MQQKPNLNLLLGVGVAVCVAAVLYFFDPNRAGFYPICLFHRTTGWLCPGCGGLRATHELLHGHVAAAFRLNALFVSLVPLALALGVWRLIALARNQPWKLEIRLAWLWIGLAVLVAFGIGRNLI